LTDIGPSSSPHIFIVHQSQERVVEIPLRETGMRPAARCRPLTV
jgi:hypothetical protein